MTISVGGGGGGGASPPTALSIVKVTGTTNIRDSIELDIGAVISSNVTSTTLTEVLNVSGSGVLTFAAIVTDFAAGADKATKTRIVIDGVEVLNDTSITLDHDKIGAIIGLYNNSPALFTEVPVPFATSLVIEIAGDGTNPMKFAHKKYLT